MNLLQIIPLCLGRTTVVSNQCLGIDISLPPLPTCGAAKSACQCRVRFGNAFTAHREKSARIHLQCEREWHSQHVTDALRGSQKKTKTKKLRVHSSHFWPPSTRKQAQQNFHTLGATVNTGEVWFCKKLSQTFQDPVDRTVLQHEFWHQTAKKRKA